MAKKVGICKNLDCDNYNKPVEIELGGEFECPLCHQPLKEHVGKKDDPSGKKKVLMIVGGLVVVAAIAIGVMLSMGKSPKENTSVDFPTEEPVAVDSTAIEEVPVEETTPEVTGEPEVVEESTSTTPQVLDGKGTIDLGYGTYHGDLKNGKPHGYGMITYKERHQIVSSKDFIANPGDTFEGEFRDGRICGLGYWEHDGNKTAIKP